MNIVLKSDEYLCLSVLASFNSLILKANVFNFTLAIYILIRIRLELEDQRWLSVLTANVICRQNVPKPEITNFIFVILHTYKYHG